MTRTISYCTALYEKQEYCQKERLDAFNVAHQLAEGYGLTLHVQLYINNSKASMFNRMNKLYHQSAKFPFHIQDLGEMKFWNYHKDSSLKMMRQDDDGNSVLLEESPDFQLFDVKHFDIYRLLAKVFNIGIDYSVNHNHAFYGILSGDQILPPEHPIALTKFLDEHENCGLASALAFYDFSKKEVDGKTYMIPLIIFRPRPGETPEETTHRTEWVKANLLPHEENGWEGLEFVDVDAVGTGGAVIPRKVFTQLKFNDNEFAGEGEDIQFCIDIRSKLGLKVFSIPTVIVKNRYPDGSLY